MLCGSFPIVPPCSNSMTDEIFDRVVLGLGNSEQCVWITTPVMAPHGFSPGSMLWLLSRCLGGLEASHHHHSHDSSPGSLDALCCLRSTAHVQPILLQSELLTVSLGHAGVPVHIGVLKKGLEWKPFLRLCTHTACRDEGNSISTQAFFLSSLTAGDLVSSIFTNTMAKPALYSPVSGWPLQHSSGWTSVRTCNVIPSRETATWTAVSSPDQVLI